MAYRLRTHLTAEDWQTLMPILLGIGFWLYFRGLKKVPT